jgi:RNA polymerase sigma factor (sigma-70 family)
MSAVLSFRSRVTLPSGAKLKEFPKGDRDERSSPKERSQKLVLLDKVTPVENQPTFDRVVLPHLDAAFRLARWLTRDHSVAEDIVQDSCVRALQYLPTFRGGDGRAWLLQIVRNAAYTRLQTLGVAVETSSIDFYEENTDEPRGPEMVEPHPGPEAVLEKQQEIARLEAAVASLPVELRECLLLREMEELSYREIAQITGQPIGTVMSRLWRARRALARTLHC